MVLQYREVVGQKKFIAKYVIPTIIEILVVLVVLLIGAMVEWQMIRTVGI
jgi:hypothetical protein